MLSILILAGIALAQTVAAGDHLECGTQVPCLRATVERELGDMCADGACPMKESLHVHVEPAQPVTMRQAPTGSPGSRVETAVQAQQPAARSRTLAIPARVPAPPPPAQAHPRANSTETSTAGAVNDFRASQTWIEGVRAENQTYQTAVQDAEQRVAAAEAARKAEEARRVAAQTRAKAAEKEVRQKEAQLLEADEVIKELLEEEPTTTEEE